MGSYNFQWLRRLNEHYFNAAGYKTSGRLEQRGPGRVEQLTPLVYGELRRLAGRYLRKERPDHALQSTALVHEAYLRLIDQKQVSGKTELISSGLRRR